jgi:hypothetical protein
MRIRILALVLALYSVTLSAQFETNYKPIQSTGQLPSDFITLSSDKYEAEKVNLKHEKGGAKKAKDQFLLESNFEIDELLLSGRVVFNDPMSDYVNKVADKVLAGDPETRSKLRFYILKSSYVNAAATNQGIIFVNMGLLAQLENEAQLAFILCHEIVHFKKKHSINQAVEADKIEKGKGSYKSFSRDEKLIANRTFSKEQETEADDEGFDIFKKTQYSTADLIGVYDVLKYSYLPFDDVAFDKSFLENNNYKIPAGFMPKETAPINTKDQSENPKSTHPSIKARREMIEGKIAKADNVGKSDYLVSKEQFDLMRTTARFELSRLYLLSHEYEVGLYNSYMLLKKYPDNIYLKKNILECLVNIAAYAESSEFDNGHVSYKDIEGKMQAVNYLFTEMDSAKPIDVVILALAYAAKLKHEYPKDKDIDEHTKYLVRLIANEGIGLDYFSDSSPPPASAEHAKDTAVSKTVAVDTSKGNPGMIIIKDDKEENSKYAKIKSQQVEKKEEVKAGKGYYAQYALVDYYNDPWVKDYFAEARKEADKGVQTEEIVIGKKSTVSRKIYRLGLEKVLIINPYYARLNANNKKKFKYLESEDGHIDFVKRLKLNGRRSKLDVDVLDSRSLGSGDVDKLNDITLLEEYVMDRLGHQNVSALYPEREKITNLAKKYNTDYFMWSGVISYKDVQKRKIVTGVMSGIFPFILPFTLSYLINGGHYTYYFNMMYDVKTDKVKMVNFREIDSRTTPSVLNSHIYDTFLQLHTNPKTTAKIEDSETDKKSAK